MKTGKTLTELAQKLEDIRENSRDFLVPSAKLEMNEKNEIQFTNGDTKSFAPTPYSHGQVASYTGVPRAYYDKLKAENPALLAKNVNHGFVQRSGAKEPGGKPETRMVRAYRGEVRAFVSSSYRRLDSYDMCQTVFPVLDEHKFSVVSSEITDSRLYIKALTSTVQAEVKRGDVVQFGLVISNSDVGAGSFRVEPLVFRLVCSNGMISQNAIRKFHIGKNLAGDDITELLSQETLSMTDAAFWAQVRDVVLASMKPEQFEVQVNRIRIAAETPIKNFDLPNVVELSMKAVGVSGIGVKENIIQYLANGADGAGLTKWGLINGFTFAAQQDSVDYDQSVQLERAGSQVLELAPHQWKKIAE